MKNTYSPEFLIFKLLYLSSVHIYRILHTDLSYMKFNKLQKISSQIIFISLFLAVFEL